MTAQGESSMTETHEQGMSAPIGSVLKKVVPWIVLALVMLRVFSWYGTYQTDQEAWLSKSNQPKPSEVASASAAAKKKAATSAADSGDKASTPASKVVIVSDVTLRKDPASTAEPVRDLSTGEQLTYIGQLGPWYKVKDEDGRTGWVSASERYTKVVTGK